MINSKLLRVLSTGISLALVPGLATAENLSINIGYSLSQNDPVYRDLLRKWASEVNAATSDSVSVALVPVDENKLIDFANAGSERGAFYTPRPEESSGYEALAALLANRSASNMSSLTELIWDSIQSDPEAAALYEGAQPVGAAVYASEAVAEITALDFDPESQFSELGIVSIGSFRPTVNAESHIVVGTESMLQEFQIDALIEGQTVDVRAYPGIDVENLGSRAGVFLISDETWEALGAEDRSALQETTMKSVYRSLGLMDWQDENSSLRFNEAQAGPINPALTDEVNSALTQRSRSIRQQLERSGLTPEAAKVQ